MQVNWSTVVAIAETQAIDLWLLVPIGVAANRLLTRKEPPPEQWAKALTRMFGTDEWKTAFYQKKKAKTLFGAEESEAREASLERVGEFFLQRLDDVFEKVAKNPLILTNSKGNPIYLLCFAAGNPKGANTAVKIASDILK
jgi:three-Cys-motif partner protein